MALGSIYYIYILSTDLNIIKIGFFLVCKVSIGKSSSIHMYLSALKTYLVIKVKYMYSPKNIILGVTFSQQNIYRFSSDNYIFTKSYFGQ